MPCSSLVLEGFAVSPKHRKFSEAIGQHRDAVEELLDISTYIIYIALHVNNVKLQLCQLKSYICYTYVYHYLLKVHGVRQLRNNPMYPSTQPIR